MQTADEEERKTENKMGKAKLAAEHHEKKLLIPVFTPEDPPLQLWSGLLAVLVFLSGVSVPLELAFYA